MNRIFQALVFTLISLMSFSQEVLYYCAKGQTGSFQVYRKNLENNAIDTITNNSGYNYWWVELSPDKSALIMMRSRVHADVKDMFDYDDCEMIKSDALGNNVEILIEDNDNFWYAFGNPHWHPQGDRLIMLAQLDSAAIVDDEPMSNAIFSIYVIDPSGNPIKQLTDFYSLDPNWSAQGDKITYIGLNENAPFPQGLADFEVFTADYDYTANSASNHKQLTDDKQRDHDPCFSPDGIKLAFSSSSVSLVDASIVTIDTLGNDRTDLVNDSSANGGPLNWGVNNKIYYHNVKFFVTPFTAKEYNVETTINTDLFPDITHGYISPYYTNLTTDGLLKNAKQNDVKLYPNPVRDLLALEPIDAKSYSIEIIAADGRILRELERMNGLAQVDVSSLPSGVYYIEIQTENSVRVARFYKQ